MKVWYFCFVFFVVFVHFASGFDASAFFLDHWFDPGRVESLEIMVKQRSLTLVVDRPLEP